MIRLLRTAFAVVLVGYFRLTYEHAWKQLGDLAVLVDAKWDIYQQNDTKQGDAKQEGSRGRYAVPIPEHQQSRILDYNYSTVNRGIFSEGKWRSQRNASLIPPLFMDRLNHYLPECPPIDAPPTNYTPCDNNIRLFPKDVDQIEREIMKFNIPRKIVIVLNEKAEYISLQHWRWNLFLDALNRTQGTRRMCPNCHIRFPDSTRRFTPPNPAKEPAHVRIHMACDIHRKVQLYGKDGTGRDFPGQLLVGDCGESQSGSGSAYWKQGIHKMDHDMSFVDQGSPFVRTYAHLHLSPDTVYNSSLNALHNVTDFVTQLLEEVPSFPRHVGNPVVRERIQKAGLTTNALEKASQHWDATFIHNNCGNQRGQLLRAMVNSKSGVNIARYGKCLHNVDAKEVLGVEDRSDWFHGDCEGNRDASKTVLASHHKFGFALENTLSPYYFTEKRWQVLLAASVPIVWDNHNSIQYLPDPDAALLIPTTNGGSTFRSTPKLAQEAAETIHYYAKEEHLDEYMDRFFAWKRRGLRPDFVRKLFLSSDFLMCRICEYAAHHYFYDDDEE